MTVIRIILIVAVSSIAVWAEEPAPTTNAVRFYLPGESDSPDRSNDTASAATQPSAIAVSPPATVSLNGDWDFYYDGISEGKKRGVSYALKEVVPEVPTEESYEATMPVPGYWDDHLPRLQPTSWWFWAQFNSNYRRIDFPMGGKYVPPFANLPYLVGTGYYRKVLFVPDEWADKKLTLSIGGVVAEAKVYVNGSRVGEKRDYLTPGEVDLSGKVQPGRNELVIAVTNRDTYARGAPTSCAIDGYQGFTGGIYGDVTLSVCSSPRIRDLYVYPASDKLRCRVEVDAVGDGSALRWTVLEVDGTTELLKGEMPLSRDGVVEWDSASAPLEKWSERNPRLYVLDIKTVFAGKVQDHRRQRFGLRTLATRDRSLFMNGKSLMLRGICDSWYYPQTTTAPIGKAAYVEMIRKYKQLGFNWIRFHTAMPRQEYLDAADELGMLIQVESPRGSDEQTWTSILKAARNHPSVILYCVSNEALLDEETIAGVVRRQELMKQHVPDALFSPMQALRGVEYGAGRDDFGPDAVDEPFLHNPRRLKMLKEVADVIQPTGWSHFSFNSAAPAKPEEIDARLDLFERPLMLHEVGIHGTYLDLSLTPRYRDSRIGTELYDSVGRYLKQNGLRDKAEVYFRNSCRWAQLLRKHAVERARLCRNVKGYDLLGAVDIHWMFCGYTCGIMNEFLELKPGESAEDVQRYNGESVLLSDLDTRRVFHGGEPFKMRLLASLFGDEPCDNATLYWNVRDDSGKVLASSTTALHQLPTGNISSLGEVQFQLPDVDEGARLRLTARLLGPAYDLSNEWAVWAFPRVNLKELDFTADEQIAGRLGSTTRTVAPEESTGSLRIVSALTDELVGFMESGGKVLLLGPGPFKSAPTSFQIAAAGRVIANQATVIMEHPVFAGLAHEGFCDWQFYDMLNGGSVVVFENPDLPFEPILEVASSYKLLKKQAAVFELGVGKGSLLVCTLNIRNDDPAGQYLLRNLIRYAGNPNPLPKARIRPEVLRAISR